MAAENGNAQSPFKGAALPGQSEACGMAAEHNDTWRGYILRRLRNAARFRNKLSAAFMVLTTVIVASSAISFFGAERLNYHLERSRLAHEAHASYLSLSSHTYELFKQLADTIIIGDLDDGAGEAALLQAARDDLNRIRLLIAQEVSHVGDEEEEGEELVALAVIERMVDDIMREFEEIYALREAGDADGAAERLKNLLDTRIDIEFNMLISEAVEGEEREVAETDAAFSRLALHLEIWTTALAFIAVPVSLLMLFSLTNGFRRAITQLIRGAETYAEGRFDHRIPDIGDKDFDVIGNRFNRMASELLASRRKMEASRDALEATVRDRTAELEEANKRLKETDGSRRRLFADISHELRTPLTVIRGEAEISLRGEEKESNEYRTSLLRIVEQVEHTTRLVDDLLFIARSDAGQPRLEMRSLAIGGLVETVVADFETVAREKSIKISKINKADGVVTIGDQGRLRQVFSILVDNAIRYSEPCGEVRVHVNHDADGVAVSIEDDGIGIAETDLEKVFDRFYRGDNAVRHAKGSGLGLPVAKAIIEAHNGHIRLSSKAGEGVTVKVTLPIEEKLRAVS